MRVLLQTTTLALLAAGAAAQNVHKVPQDHPTIQEAVDAASNGDEIQISAGTYHESVLVTGFTSLNFTGKGKVVIAPDASPGLTLDNSSGVFIQGLSVQGGSVGFNLMDSHTNVLFKCNVDSPTGDGIHVEGGFGNNIEKCTVRKAGNNAISLAAGSLNFTNGNLVVVCKFIEPVGDGVSVNGSGNLVDGCTATKPGGHGFSIDDTTAGTGNHIQNDKVVKSGGDGLVSSGDANRFKNMKVIGAGGNGADVSGGTDSRFETCKFVKPAGDGFFCFATAAQLTDSKISKPGGDGVRQQGDDAVISGVKVSGASGTGFRIEGDNGSYTGNSSTGAKGDGFDLTGSTGNTLDANKAKGSKGFDLNNPVPADNTVLDTNSFKTKGP